MTNEEMEIMLSNMIEEIYQNSQHFISAYSTNPKKVLVEIINKLKIVPYNIKNTLESFYVNMIIEETDDYKPIK